jgi:preprotein translocase subunit SecA
MRTSDLAKFFKEISFCQYYQIVNEDLDSFIQKRLDEYLTAMIEEKAILITENFKEFYERQKHRWIRSAIEALYYYEENINYVVLDGQIKPVDYYSTGIVQSATNWGDGLHQFLQLKHNLNMTCETLTTNFLSNIGFIKSYEHVYGLTGTLGSTYARNILQEVNAYTHQMFYPICPRSQNDIKKIIYI